MWTYSGFDLGHLTQLYGPMNGVQPADAMIAFHLLHPDERSKDLGTRMAMYTRWGYHKNLERRNPILYNTLDTVGCLEAGVKMYQEMRGFPIDITPLFWTLNSIQLDLQSWQTIGAPYDQALSDQFELRIIKSLDQYEKFWRSKFPLNDWSSPKQLISLFTAMKIPIPMKTRKKKDGTAAKTPTVDEEALATIAAKGSAVAKLIIQMRQLRKSGDFTNLAVRGRLRTRAKIHGQAGGRIQCVDKNIQQIPEEMLVTSTPGSGVFPRRCVIAESPDDAVIAADFSQIEFWLYAYFSGCQKLIDIKNRGEYLYGDFYEAIWNEPFFLPGKPRTKSNRDDSRTPPWKLLVAKSWPLGFIYGRGVPGVEGLPIAPSKAKQIRMDFFRAYPEISAYHNKIMFEATKQGYLQTPFGRMRRFPNPTAQRGSLLAFPGQSTAPDILVQKVILGAGRAIGKIFGPRSRLYFTVHDSGIFNIQGAGKDPGVARAAVEYIKSEMESPIPELKGFSIPAEVKIGPSWGDTSFVEKYVAKITAPTTGNV
jgi:DNA polymerase-1